MLYVEYGKAAPLSCVLPKSKKTLHLYKGLNKVSKEDWAEMQEMPMMKGLKESGDLKESQVKVREAGEKKAAAPKKESKPAAKPAAKKVEPKKEGE
jgi:hypothetical protein